MFQKTVKKFRADGSGEHVVTLSVGAPVMFIRLGMTNLDGDTEESCSLVVEDAEGLTALDTSWDGDISIPFDRFIEWGTTPSLNNDGGTADDNTYLDIPLVSPITLSFGNLVPGAQYRMLLIWKDV